MSSHNRYVSGDCPYCQTAFEAGEKMIECARCHTFHHDDCWRANGGCAVYGCDGTTGSAPIAQAVQSPTIQRQTSKTAIDIRLYPTLVSEIADTARDFAYAGFWRRFAAAFIDLFIINVCVIAIQIIIILTRKPYLVEMRNVVFYAVLIAYNTYFIGKSGATPGKKFLKLQVIPAIETTQMSYSRAFARYIAQLLSLLTILLGYFWMLWDANKQTWHDKIAKTYVVYDRNEASVTRRAWAAVIGCFFGYWIVQIIFGAIV